MLFRNHVWHYKSSILVLVILYLPVYCAQSGLVNSISGIGPLVQGNSISSSSFDHKTFQVNWSKYQSNIRYFHSDQRCIDDIVSSNYNEIVSVNTKYGKLTGRISYLCDMPGLNVRDRPVSFAQKYSEHTILKGKVVANVTLFLGIPYAKSPTKENNLRFKSPLPPDFWGSMDAVQFRSSCPQPIQFTGPHRMIEKVDEDCLYLNIFSPKVSKVLLLSRSLLLYFSMPYIIYQQNNILLASYQPT